MAHAALPPPTRVARAVVGMLAVMLAVVGASVLGLFTFVLLFAGVPWWVVAPVWPGTALLLVLAGRRVRERAERG